MATPPAAERPADVGRQLMERIAILHKESERFHKSWATVITDMANYTQNVEEAGQKRVSELAKQVQDLQGTVAYTRDAEEATQKRVSELTKQVQDLQSTVEALKITGAGPVPTPSRVPAAPHGTPLNPPLSPAESDVHIAPLMEASPTPSPQTSPQASPRGSMVNGVEGQREPLSDPVQRSAERLPSEASKGRQGGPPGRQASPIPANSSPVPKIVEPVPPRKDVVTVVDVGASMRAPTEPRNGAPDVEVSGSDDRAKSPVKKARAKNGRTSPMPEPKGPAAKAEEVADDSVVADETDSGDAAAEGQEEEWKAEEDVVHWMKNMCLDEVEKLRNLGVRVVQVGVKNCCTTKRDGHRCNRVEFKTNFDFTKIQEVQFSEVAIPCPQKPGYCYRNVILQTDAQATISLIFPYLYKETVDNDLSHWLFVNELLQEVHHEVRGL